MKFEVLFGKLSTANILSKVRDSSNLWIVGL
jgi:hypothetical protein